MLDAVSLNSTQFQEMAENGSAELLESLDPDPELYPIATEAFYHEEQLYAYPISFSPWCCATTRLIFGKRIFLSRIAIGPGMT